MISLGKETIMSPEVSGFRLLYLILVHFIAILVRMNLSRWMAVLYTMTRLVIELFFFFKCFGGHESFFWGHWYPCFGLPVTSPLGFKARMGSALFELSRGICVTLHVPWDSPLVWHLLTSWQPAWQPSHLFQAMRGIGGTRNQELSCCRSQCEIRQTFYRLSYPGSALVLELCFFPLADKNTLV